MLELKQAASDLLAQWFPETSMRKANAMMTIVGLLVVVAFVQLVAGYQSGKALAKLEAKASAEPKR